MGIILAKFRKEKSTQEVLEALQEKIDTLENFTYDTQQQKKRIVGNFVAASIGVYIIAFAVFYFIYFPPTWRDRIIYSIPLLVFPFIIILLRHLFTWYFQRKLNKNSKKLTVLRAEKKKILEQVMDKETYKVAVNLLSRFADKPSRSAFSAASSTMRTPLKTNQPSLNRSLPTTAMKTNQLALTASTPNVTRVGNTSLASAAAPVPAPTFAGSTTPRTATTAMSPYNSASSNSGSGQIVRRRTPFPVVNQNEKGVFEKIVDVLIGDGPGDRFAMICKECYGHNGMALKEDFEYTTFRCAFCNALNPARKSRPVAPRLSVLPKPSIAAGDSSSDDKDDSDDERPAASDATLFATPLMAAMAARNSNVDASSSSSSDERSQQRDEPTNNEEALEEERANDIESKADNNENIEKSDSAIDDVSPEE
ncbi:endoplasmic reticulum junction formation protein lunapark-B [Stomoxys calcitrans]|uniref:Endoplasmic reticulum junction formation protein lunapark n=1 Tax=Stomoxys calcitrans TaxID=35570 RepID=A0A1I8QE07_STOCA|nr:endoplasmic reticulum junction formation protein lunapark-B [Stomoxys calcitrans]